MNKFEKRNSENDEWWGFNSEHGWVVLDRTLFGNGTGNNKSDKLTFTRCSDWTEFVDLRSNWDAPKYTYVVQYLKKLTGEKLKEAEAEALSKLNYYINYQYEIRVERLKRIHNAYLELHGLPPKSIVKRQSDARRVSHCWNCSHPVDNKVDYECEGCGWIVCGECGACEKPHCGDAKITKKKVGNTFNDFKLASEFAKSNPKMKITRTANENEWVVK